MLATAARTLGFAIFLVMIVAAALRSSALGWPPLIWLAGSIVVVIIRAPYARAIKQNVISEDRKGALETLLLAGMVLAMGWFPLVHLAFGVFGFADYALPKGIAYLGAALQLPYLWLFWRSHADLGQNWSPTLEIREDHGLVTGGVYARIRHPMYAAIWIGAIAQPLLIQNWIAGFFVIPTFLAMYLIRTPREEDMMRTRFGEDYDRYTERTGRIVPPRSSRAGSAI